MTALSQSSSRRFNQSIVSLECLIYLYLWRLKIKTEKGGGGKKAGTKKEKVTAGVNLTFLNCKLPLSYSNCGIQMVQ